MPAPKQSQRASTRTSQTSAGESGTVKPTQEAAILDFPVQLTGNLNDAAYEHIRQALMNGRLIPGQAFTIRALGTAFGTSPMPVRDALKRLLAEGALEMRRNRSVEVPIMSRKRFQEILQVRLHIEPDLAARATSRITNDAIEAMSEDHRQMCEATEAGDLLRFLSHNRGFHFRLYKAADTVMLLSLVETLWTQIGPHLRQVVSERAPRPTRPEHHHLAILRALRRQDPAAVAQAVFDDIAGAADAILAGDTFHL